MTADATLDIGLLDMVQTAAQDVREAVRFYRDVLCATVQTESDQWSQVHLGGVDIGIHKAPSTHERWVPSFRVADIAAVRAAVQAAGRPLLSDYHDIPGGVVLSFADPAGNPVQVVQQGISEAELES